MPTTTTLQGTIAPAGLSDVLLSLQAASVTGRLRAWRDDVTRDLYLRSGQVVCADSTSSSDSLEWMLFTAGEIAPDRHQQVREMIAAGARRGRALVESGCLSSAALCHWTARRARFLASDLLTWREGGYEFEMAVEPPAGTITVSFSPEMILLEMLRGALEGAQPLRAAQPHRASMAPDLPAADAVLAARPGPHPDRDLLAHESYVMSLADGTRPVSEICFLSEMGEMETLRILALLARAGCLVGAGAEAARADTASPATAPPRASLEAALAAPDLPPGDSSSELRGIVRIYNDLFAIVVGHVIKEVGPIAEQLLDKHLREVRELHAGLLARAGGGRDGSLSEDVLVRNVNLIKQPNRRDLLVRALGDYLQALLAAVRRLLGPEHEAAVLRRLKDARCTRT